MRRSDREELAEERAERRIVMEERFTRGELLDLEGRLPPRQ
jgi:hypothetical protein